MVLGIDPAVLWNKDCAFCRHNAADNRISGQPLEALQTVEAFAGMFEEIDGVTSREEQQLKPFDPTDGQAEILVFDVIEPALIRGVVFEGNSSRDEHLPILGDRKVLVQAPKRGYFASRSYARIRR
ncbi:MAG: hypothetical protein NAOJABEB_01482 [Steroidobacteraceae bacterium]|nr:hypothetical protein [Steroidobacteraceae bacterium]